MKSITEIMTRNVEKVDVSWSTLQVIALMREKKIGSVIVENNGDAVGIFTERDLLTRVDLTRPSGLLSLGINEVMTPVVITVGASKSLVEVVSLMRQNNLRHLPVEENGQIVGLVSSRDLLEHYQGYLEHAIANTKSELESAVRNSRASHKYFRDVFEDASIAIIVTDTNQRIISWNKFALTILEMSPLHINKQPISQFFGDDQWTKTIADNIALSERNDHPYHLEAKLLKDDSSPMNVALSVGAAKENSGVTFGTVYIISPRYNEAKKS